MCTVAVRTRLAMESPARWTGLGPVFHVRVDARPIPQERWLRLDPGETPTYKCAKRRNPQRAAWRQERMSVRN